MLRTFFACGSCLRLLPAALACGSCLLLAAAGCKKDDCAAGDNASSPVQDRGKLKVVLLDSATSAPLYGTGRPYPPDSVHQLYPGGDTVFLPHTALAADTAGEDGFLLSYYTGAGTGCDGQPNVRPGTADSILVRLGSADVDTLVVYNTRDYLTEFRWNGITRISVQPVASPLLRTIVVYK